MATGALWPRKEENKTAINQAILEMQAIPHTKLSSFKCARKVFELISE